MNVTIEQLTLYSITSPKEEGSTTLRFVVNNQTQRARLRIELVGERRAAEGQRVGSLA